jgi:hypothetical protein
MNALNAEAVIKTSVIKTEGHQFKSVGRLFGLGHLEADQAVP